MFIFLKFACLNLFNTRTLIYSTLNTNCVFECFGLIILALFEEKINISEFLSSAMLGTVVF